MASNEISKVQYYTKKQLVQVSIHKPGSILEQQIERIKTARMLTKVGKAAGLPYYTICSSIYLYHRYYRR